MELWENPMGTDGFALVEYAAPDPALLEDLFTRMGFAQVARHRRHAITLWRQGAITFVLNAVKDGHAARFAAEHGSSITAIGFRVADGAKARDEALRKGAQAGRGDCLDQPVIEGIGGSLLYLLDDPDAAFAAEYDFTGEAYPQGAGLTYIDHLTHNVHQGRMDHWADFYSRLFNFREIRYFDIEGKLTGLKSRAMTSPCGKIRIPINESADDKSQIEEYLREYKGEGVQHVALGTGSLVSAVERLKAAGLKFLDTPDSYYELLETRLPGHGLDVAPLQHNCILVDGAPTEGQGLLLQIFTENVIGPIFFELIERRGNEGFGEGNFRALFESIELDQIRRGVLKEAS
ncbi:4-hydroxyphenylpyruvate dioxygenase [Telmatospirillum sp. J64-1]|uniref:4-hydroxyphenylpyruvate dioxygenase n=1 Tax=Telmatospirillum sp. J64-1 TaxID=2502183 RepID=UPI00115E1A83|nr:4-hydroxyphenylpyruvate dioxygenase [Telmatospirillum sp. J64-1]